ncbi:hypothetical protein HOLleu_19886 [Holothuria leucospilota]|uniref:Uncharacterized protein n=1 Tax=Holothuria leucospilota TaxID=206669 RepID=A0A9Q1H801_HOLLE|nr:hypothetical protein HOLleu_19886 [Holothuria leucospilota]
MRTTQTNIRLGVIGTDDVGFHVTIALVFPSWFALTICEAGQFQVALELVKSESM